MKALRQKRGENSREYPSSAASHQRRQANGGKKCQIGRLIQGRAEDYPQQKGQKRQQHCYCEAPKRPLANDLRRSDNVHNHAGVLIGPPLRINSPVWRKPD